MSTYNVSWLGQRVVVEATVDVDVRSKRVGAVNVQRVTLDTGEGDARPEGTRIDLLAHTVAESQALYAATRVVAGLCAACEGKRRATVDGMKNGRRYRKAVKCSACSGTGKKVVTW